MLLASIQLFIHQYLQVLCKNYLSEFFSKSVLTSGIPLTQNFALELVELHGVLWAHFSISCALPWMVSHPSVVSTELLNFVSLADWQRVHSISLCATEEAIEPSQDRSLKDIIHHQTLPGHRAVDHNLPRLIFFFFFLIFSNTPPNKDRSSLCGSY